MAEGQDRTQGSGGVGQGDSLQKEISRREAFERKNAELEGVNDELRVENGVSYCHAYALNQTLVM